MPDTGFATLRLGYVPALNPNAGGVFQYSATMVSALTSISSEGAWLAPVALLPDDAPEVRARFTAAGWATSTLEPPPGALRATLRRLAGEGPHRDAWRRLRRSARGLVAAPVAGAVDVVAARPATAAWWRRSGIELMLFPQPHALAFEGGLPFVVAVHDLQHRLQPEFPEVSADGEWARREYILRNCIRRAERVLVDSDVGKEQVLFFYGAYGARAERVDVLPFLPAPLEGGEPSKPRRDAVRARFGIPDQYLLYPAAFWPHKNHPRIVAALEHLAHARGLRVHAVFCGSRGDATRDGQFRLVMEMAALGGVADLVHVPGYLSDDELGALYAGATALVMPTFFGPTNIPVIEAWAHGCPVITSNIPGIREQVGDTAILVDPKAVDELADAIARLVTDAALRRDLAARGSRRLAAYTPVQYEDRLRDSLRRASGRDLSTSVAQRS